MTRPGLVNAGAVSFVLMLKKTKAAFKGFKFQYL